MLNIFFKLLVELLKFAVTIIKWVGVPVIIAAFVFMGLVSLHLWMFKMDGTGTAHSRAA